MEIATSERAMVKVVLDPDHPLGVYLTDLRLVAVGNDGQGLGIQLSRDEAISLAGALLVQAAERKT